jgi:DNA ligase D-like protein (predicted 3'-phosphoesterase)
VPDRDLATYRAKRDFSNTPEPSGKSKSGRARQPRFVIQKHAATSLHYDFRLEVAGVLKSWAVPKGPSTDPRDKRLAMPTEDHPLDYFDFEGVIPKGNYGAGPVIVWDVGVYRNITVDQEGAEIELDRALEEGHASVWLQGHKIKGGYSLRRVSIGRDGREKWLLMKKRDETADARRNPVSSQPESVLTGRRIEELVD